MLLRPEESQSPQAWYSASEAQRYHHAAGCATAATVAVVAQGPVLVDSDSQHSTAQ
ncbi:hypothetical protein HaLaN_30430, partial [Haematococcus lacustris]